MRKLVLAAVLAIACTAAMAQAAGAAASFSLSSTSNNQAGAPTNLTVFTSLSGSGNATKQYGAAISIPKTLHIKYSTYGATGDMCPGSAIQPMSTGYTPAATSFDPSTCPPTAVVGTVKRILQTGYIYLVNTTPMPSLALYFDSGPGTPYGRGMEIDYSGSSQILRVNGLSNMSASQLVMYFINPSRPGGLQPELWNWTEPDDLSVCNPVSQIAGGIYTYPVSGTAATPVAATPKTLKTIGCGVGFKLTTDTPRVANATTAVKIETPLTGAGNDRLQFGASVDTSSALFPKYVNFGSSSQMCSGASVQPMSTGYYPEPWSFDNSTCPPTANVGTASIGGATGTIYTVNTTPVPSFGVWFDQGVAQPYGRALRVDWNNSAPTISILGLPNSPSSGLTLDFNNPSRPTLPSKVWAFAQPGTSQCTPSFTAKGKSYLYPPTGSAMDVTYPQNVFLSLTGC